jgi:serine/threonine-protein kinase
VSGPQLTHIGKYQLTDVLGEGAMGVVYRAFDPVLNRYVAIKLMSQGIATDQQLRERFLREARTAGSLQHPNIVTIYDFGEQDGHLFIAMEYIEGSDLAEIISRRDPLPLPAKLQIVIDMCNALAYAHGRGVVHRDVKPHNVRVSVDGRARLMDFGIARVEETTHLTQSGMLLGTPNFMAPEQITGSVIGPGTDIFATGAVLYLLLTYAMPFPGTTLHEVLFKITSEEPPSVKSLVPSLPDALAAIVERAMAKDPARRYPDALTMGNDLSAVKLALSGGSGQVSIIARRTPLGTAGVAAAPRPRRPARWLVAGGGVALALLLAVVIATRDRAPEAAPGSGVAAPMVGSPRDSPEAVAARPTESSPSLPQAGGARAATATSGGPPPTTAPAAAATPTRETAAPPSPPAPSAQLPRLEPSRTESVPQTAPAAAPPSPVAAPPPTAPAREQPPPATPADPRAEIQRQVEAYARAIESRAVSQIRAAYPGLTPAQAQGWEQFFPLVRNLRVRLSVTQLEVGEGGAEATVTGTYEYENTTTGRAERQPVRFQASLTREAGAWRLAAIR